MRVLLKGNGNMIETETKKNMTTVKELIEKEYLVKTKHPDISNYYIFYEDPRLCRKNACE